MKGRILREQLDAQLVGGQAYMPLDQAIREFPWSLAGQTVRPLRHTAWEILEHMRIAQWDILNFTLDPNHVTPPWPDEHWPRTPSPANEAAWNRSVETFFEELAAVRALAADPHTNLFEPIPHGTGQTVLREILLVADHNAYHLGQFLSIRRALGA